MDTYKQIKRWIGKLTVILIMVIFPFVIHDKLNDVTVTRYRFFVIVTMLSFICMLVNEIVHCLKNKCHTKMFASGKRNIICAGLILSACMSYALSPYKSYALYGKVGRYTGMIFFQACAVIYFVISETYTFEKNDMVLMGCSSIVVNVIAILNYYNADILKFFSHITYSQSLSYISTMGNIDIYGMYVVMMFCISLYGYIASDGGVKILYGAATVLAETGAVISNSDLAVAGMIAGLVITVMFCLGSYNKIMDVFLMIVLCLVSGQIMNWCEKIFYLNPRELDGIAVYIKSQRTMIIAIIFCLCYVAVVYFQDKLRKIFSQWPEKMLQRVYSIFAVCAIAILIIITIVDNVIGKGPLYISDEWGTGRGYIWKNLWNAYGNYPIINKIFGLGEGTVRQALSYYSDSRMNMLKGSVVDNAHNIFLNILVTMGIAGVVVMFAMLLDCVINVKKFYKQNYWIAAFGIAAVTYAIQGMGNLLEVITFPMFICMMAIVQSFYRDKKLLHDLE